MNPKKTNYNVYIEHLEKKNNIYNLTNLPFVVMVAKRFSKYLIHMFFR